VSRYHRLSRIASEPIEVECPDCMYEIQVWLRDTEAECMSCGSEFSVDRATDGVSLEPMRGEPGEEWEIPDRLYHGTSLKRFREMLTSPKSFELYLADSEEGTGMYAETASGEDESPPLGAVFDVGKLMSAGRLMPDWDDVSTMIANGDDLFGGARSADEVSWMDSLRLINTCSYEGDLSGTIVEVRTDDGVLRPPF